MKIFFGTRECKMIIVLIFAMSVMFVVDYLEDIIGNKAFYISASIIFILLVISIRRNYLRKTKS